MHFIRLFVYLRYKNENMIDNKGKKVDEKDVGLVNPVPSARKKFHGFSMGFLLILLAVVVVLYVVCAILAV